MVRRRNRAALKLALLGLAAFAWATPSASAMDFFARTRADYLPQDVSDLPLIVTNTNIASDSFVIWVSGDGGWSILEREIAARLAERGIATIGVNSFLYFNTPRSSRETADALERIASAFAQEWGRSRIIFVGYSFGADVGPSAFLQSSNLRGQIQTAIFLSPSPHLYHESGIHSWLGLGRGAANLNALRALTGPKLICVQGEEDAKSACDEAARADMTAITLPSGHTLHGDGAHIANIILEAASEPDLTQR